MARLSELVEAARALAARTPAHERAVLGIVGPPGAGKSTLAEHLAAALRASGLGLARVPMDGFHLAEAELVRLGRRERMGAPDTFDAAGFAALLVRVRTEVQGTVYAPDFDRAVHQLVAGSIPVLPEHRVVITEGNYLLLPDPAWERVHGCLDEVWYCELPDEVRLPRLVARHERFGKAPAAAAAWVATVDEPNARLIASTRDRADTVVDIEALGPRRAATDPGCGHRFGKGRPGRRGAPGVVASRRCSPEPPGVVPSRPGWSPLPT